MRGIFLIPCVARGWKKTQDDPLSVFAIKEIDGSITVCSSCEINTQEETFRGRRAFENKAIQQTELVFDTLPRRKS